MVKTKSGFVLATAFLSGIAVALSIASLATEEWVTARGEFNNNPSSDPLSTIKYGLFSGTFWQMLGGQTVFQLTMTCVIEENACAYICETSPETRRGQLKKLIRGESVSFNPSCPRVRRMDERQAIIPRETFRNDNYKFINAGLYISTVLFISISIVFGLVTAILSFYNTVSNPIEVYFSISGLYVYNTIACFSSIIAISLWSALFGIMLVDNIGILYTIRGQMSTRGFADLGYSFWLLIPSCLLYPISIGILYTRQYLIEQEPEIKIHTAPGEADVGDVMIY